MKEVDPKIAAAAFERLPHRYPFLYVDKIVDYDIEKGEIKALKNVSINEHFFQGHFPGMPIMPGVLILEGMAQTAGLLHFLDEENKGDIVFFAGMDKVRFRKKVVPGDQLIYEVKIIRKKRSIVKLVAKAYLDGELAVEAEFLANISKQ